MFSKEIKVDLYIPIPLPPCVTDVSGYAMGKLEEAFTICLHM